MSPPVPVLLSPGQATELIRTKAREDHFSLVWTGHAIARMEDRGLLTGDILHVLKHGYVHAPGEKSTRPVHYKYQMEGTTPNSNGRKIRIVVIPLPDCGVKVLTVMWVDEDG